MNRDELKRDSQRVKKANDLIISIEFTKKRLKYLKLGDSGDNYISDIILHTKVQSGHSKPFEFNNEDAQTIRQCLIEILEKKLIRLEQEFEDI